MLCHSSMRNTNRSGLAPKRRKEEITLLLERSGVQSNVDELRAAAERAAKEDTTTSFESSGHPKQIDGLWSDRKVTAKASLVAKNDPSDLWIHSDAAVPLSRLADLIEFFHARIDEADHGRSVTDHIGNSELILNFGQATSLNTHTRYPKIYEPFFLVEIFFPDRSHVSSVKWSDVFPQG